MFALRMLMERYREGQKELHCVFVCICIFICVCVCVLLHLASFLGLWCSNWSLFWIWSLPWWFSSLLTFQPLFYSPCKSKRFSKFSYGCWRWKTPVCMLFLWWFYNNNKVPTPWVILFQACNTFLWCIPLFGSVWATDSSVSAKKPQVTCMKQKHTDCL